MPEARSFARITVPRGYDPSAYIAANEWKQARTYQSNPHQYLLWDLCTDLIAQARLVKWISAEGGYTRTFRGRRYHYRELDGWVYWAMHLTVNRRRVEDEPIEDAEP